MGLPGISPAIMGGHTPEATPGGANQKGQIPQEEYHHDATA